MIAASPTSSSMPLACVFLMVFRSVFTPPLLFFFKKIKNRARVGIMITRIAFRYKHKLKMLRPYKVHVRARKLLPSSSKSLALRTMNKTKSPVNSVSFVPHCMAPPQSGGIARKPSVKIQKPFLIPLFARKEII